MGAAEQPNATIYVALLGEGTDVWRPVLAAACGGCLFRITSENEDPDDEHWQFTTGTLVRCESRRLASGEQLVAISEER